MVCITVVLQMSQDKSKCVGSYTESPNWIKSKKATINSKTENDRSFQYAATIAINFDGIKKEPQRFSDIKPFINKYNSDAIKYSSK